MQRYEAAYGESSVCGQIRKMLTRRLQKHKQRLSGELKLKQIQSDWQNNKN